MRAERIQIALKEGPPAKQHFNGVSLVGGWWPTIECWISSFVIFGGSGPELLRKPIFCNFPGGGSGTPVPPLDPHVCTVLYKK